MQYFIDWEGTDETIPTAIVKHGVTDIMKPYITNAAGDKVVL
jgi:hypothetical protein